jgi:hypothetical protein
MTMDVNSVARALKEMARAGLVIRSTTTISVNIDHCLSSGLSPTTRSCSPSRRRAKRRRLVVPRGDENDEASMRHQWFLGPRTEREIEQGTFLFLLFT